MPDIDQKINARMKLMLSAKTARTQGISRDEWEKAEVVQEFVSKADLRYDIVEHIAAWVWTFRRR